MRNEKDGGKQAGDLMNDKEEEDIDIDDSEGFSTSSYLFKMISNEREDEKDTTVEDVIPTESSDQDSKDTETELQGQGSNERTSDDLLDTQSQESANENNKRNAKACKEISPRGDLNRQFYSGYFCLRYSNWNDTSLPPIVGVLLKARELSIFRGEYGGNVYRGNDIPPGQMSAEQYAYIALTYMAIPHQDPKELFLKGDERDYYRPPYKISNNATRGEKFDRKPNMLFFGCGRDTPLWLYLAKAIGGRVVIIESDPKWFDSCKKFNNLTVGENLFFYQGSSFYFEHQKLLSNLVSSRGATADEKINGPGVRTTYNLAKALTTNDFLSQQKIKLSKDILNIPFDVIVVDGPPGSGNSPGRSQPLYLAARMALSYSKYKKTHIFLHDASRMDELTFANAILGHHPEQYHGNSLPRKGLKHWSILGEELPMFEFDGDKGAPPPPIK